MKIFSFFSGIGFLDLGFEDEGFEVVFVNELHKPFLDAYKYSREKLNYEAPALGYSNSDILKLTEPNKIKWLKKNINQYREQNELVGYIGGPPCPDFSVGGKNKGRKGDNGKLSGTYIDIVMKTKPDFFLFENVKGLWRTKKHRKFFDELKSKISKNYYTTERLINAIEYSVPQDRERIILLGFKKSLFQNGYSSKKLTEEFPWTDFTDYDKNEVLDLNWVGKEKFIENSEKTFSNSVPRELTVQHWFELNNVDDHPNSKHHFIPRAAKPKFEIIEEGDDSKKSYKRLHRWRYSPTAAYGNNEVHLHPYKARRLSASESLAIQSMPIDFELPPDMTLTNMFKGIGNGVPYLASRGLARSINAFIEEI